ncbi:MAG: formate dehydrogenase accessory sulfurtransferase FdhD [Saprospiraceae bacterium]|nr:formate dehydrogenase accessory sulfurtransferase FdhD [Candidatus Parvibacillus calidus]
MEEKLIIPVNIERLSEDMVFSKQDVVMIEQPLQMDALGPEGNMSRISITMRTPGHDAELALGFLFNEGLLQTGDAASVANHTDNNILIKMNHNIQGQASKRNFLMTSSCGVCGKSELNDLKINAPVRKIVHTLDHRNISSMYEWLKKEQKAFAETGGCHGAGVFDYEGHMITGREDVGRHNAVDKCAGYLWENNLLEKEEYVLCLSGRGCYELIQKAIRMNCTTVICIGAVTSLAIETAHQYGITLIGFFKPYNFNIYTYKERII